MAFPPASIGWEAIRFSELLWTQSQKIHAYADVPVIMRVNERNSKGSLCWKP
jgi:hypothetical protein